MLSSAVRLRVGLLRNRLTRQCYYTCSGETKTFTQIEMVQLTKDFLADVWSRVAALQEHNVFYLCQRKSWCKGVYFLEFPSCFGCNIRVTHKVCFTWAPFHSLYFFTFLYCTKARSSWINNSLVHSADNTASHALLLILNNKSSLAIHQARSKAPYLYDFKGN